MPGGTAESPTENPLLTLTNAAQLRFAGYFPLRMLVGGIEVSPGDVEQALVCLRSSAGLMIKQPLARISSPLADCDYHAVSAPWRDQFMAGSPAGRGAAGRSIAKDAFCFALEQTLIAADPQAALRQLLDDAMLAFSSDHAYAAAIARAAVGIAAKKHTALLRAQLRQAAHQAVSQCDLAAGTFRCDNASPCGTGDCRFAQGDLVFIETSSLKGKQTRPANWPGAGATFSSDDALPALEKLSPFVVPVPIRDADEGFGLDAVPLT